MGRQVKTCFGRSGCLMLGGLLLAGPFTAHIAWAQAALGYTTSTLGRTIFVHPTGNATANAAALTATLGSTVITGRTTPADEPVLIEIGPGTYDFGTTSTAITMPDHVDFRGAGMDRTVLKCACTRVIEASGTTNRFSEFTIESSANDGRSIEAVSGANTVIHRLRSSALFGMVSSASTVNISNSILLSTGDDALNLGSDSTVTVEQSHIDGPDSGGDGVVFIGSAPGNVFGSFYNFIGANGIRTPAGGAGGTQTCVATRSATAFSASGCPAP